MRIKFMESGESPDIGVFDAGLERDVHDGIGALFIERGLAVEVKEEDGNGI